MASGSAAAHKAEFEQLMMQTDLAPIAQQSGMMNMPPMDAMGQPYMNQQAMSFMAGSSPAPQVKRRHETYETPEDERRKRGSRQPISDKSSKGLRHFSMKVCQKVKEKGVTTYNEVADELVQEQQLAEELNQEFDDDQPHGPKNIRRRVYDALNVLMAMNIISKEKKEIRWIGLPSSSLQELSNLEDARAAAYDRIRKREQQLQELILQQIAFKNLVKRNESLAQRGEADAANSIHLPFIIVYTSKHTVIDCQMAEDKSEYFFDFDQPFEIHDDIEVLKRMGMAFGLETGNCSDEHLEEARGMIPPALESYLMKMRKGPPSANEGSSA